MIHIDKDKYYVIPEHKYNAMRVYLMAYKKLKEKNAKTQEKPDPKIERVFKHIDIDDNEDEQNKYTIKGEYLLQ